MASVSNINEFKKLEVDGLGVDELGDELAMADTELEDSNVVVVVVLLDVKNPKGDQGGVVGTFYFFIFCFQLELGDVDEYIVFFLVHFKSVFIY